METYAPPQAYYHSIERFGTVDGPGIRYVLFLSGCQLRCRFCHNPDTWQTGQQKISVDEVMADLIRYRHFYDASSGGLTLSGGEPLLQPDFSAALLKASQSVGLHTIIDTAGSYPRQHLERVLPHTDTIMFSVKAVNNDKHRWLAGFSNELIFDNLRYASGQRPVILRYVILPGVTNLPQDIQALGDLILSLPGQVVTELLPYHRHGLPKWQALNLSYTLEHVPEATSQDIITAADSLRARGIAIINDPEIRST